ncbi:MAG: SUMF1/EgtB/PvdO family nonheme iron enzyme [Cytophagales bacterium]|nr:SUMF1/EgtB/PvdO family nonheme iron enzyme [Cytophagales bacterium]
MYHMLGNVWEWTQDYYNEKLFASSVSDKKRKRACS